MTGSTWFKRFVTSHLYQRWVGKAGVEGPTQVNRVDRGQARHPDGEFAHLSRLEAQPDSATRKRHQTECEAFEVQDHDRAPPARNHLVLVREVGRAITREVVCASPWDEIAAKCGQCAGSSAARGANALGPQWR